MTYDSNHQWAIIKYCTVPANFVSAQHWYCTMVDIYIKPSVPLTHGDANHSSDFSMSNFFIQQYWFSVHFLFIFYVVNTQHTPYQEVK